LDGKKVVRFGAGVSVFTEETAAAYIVWEATNMGSIPKEMILWKCKPAAAAIFRKETADANAAAIRICPAVPRDMNMSADATDAAVIHRSAGIPSGRPSAIPGG
jgi:hypothetical protein